MRRSLALLPRRLLTTREFSTSSEKIVASVLFERLPVVIPKIDPVVYAFQEFSFRWRQQYSRRYPDEFLNKSNSRSLQRALDRRLYLLLYGKAHGSPDDKPIWHFPQKIYDSEETLRKCAESALQSVLGDLSHTYFVGNAPMGHLVVQPEEKPQDLSYKQFFFKSQVIATNEFKISKCQDFVWVTKDELLEIFPEHADYFKKMIIS
ncbi:39S ribosomal protein L46, mitochondrial [Linum perenne]